MVFNLCPEDRLDFVGDISDPDVLNGVAGKRQKIWVPDFVGFQFYFIPDTSRTGQRRSMRRNAWG